MNASLVPCSACHRHVFDVEKVCPFCGVELTEKRPLRRAAPAARMSRAALFALGTIATSTVACGGDTKEGGDDTDTSASTTGSTASTTASTKGSSTTTGSGTTSVGPVYGAPATGGASATGSGGTGGEGDGGSGGAAGASGDGDADGIGGVGGVGLNNTSSGPTPVYGAPPSPERPSPER